MVPSVYCCPLLTFRQPIFSQILSISNTLSQPPQRNTKNTMAAPTDIPGPKGLPFIGNVLDLQDEVPLRAIERLADIHGPIFRISILGREMLIVSGYDLFNELCDETRFYKLLAGKLRDATARDPSTPQGLFTQLSEKEDDWGQAHRILMPAFGPLAIAEMFPGKSYHESQMIGT